MFSLQDRPVIMFISQSSCSAVSTLVRSLKTQNQNFLSRRNDGANPPFNPNYNLYLYLYIFIYIYMHVFARGPKTAAVFLRFLKPFVFKVLRNGLLRYILFTCPNLVITFVFKVLRNGLLRYILYNAQTCDNVRVQSATQWTASVHTLQCPNL